MIEVFPSQMVRVDLLDDSEENPNEMSDDEFSELVAEIIENGWTVPVQAIGPNADGRYKLYGGHHRKKAAMVLGMEEIPVVVIPEDRYDDDVRKIQLVKQNILHGSMNAVKFTELFNDLAKKYDAAVLQKMMAFTKEDAFNRVYMDAKKALPPGMAEKLDELRDELKTVDDLSLALNRLFTDYGDTLMYSFMVFSYGGREHLMVRMKDISQFKRFKKFADWCVENKVQMDEELMARVNWPT